MKPDTVPAAPRPTPSVARPTLPRPAVDRRHRSVQDHRHVLRIGQIGEGCEDQSLLTWVSPLETAVTRATGIAGGNGLLARPRWLLPADPQRMRHRDRRVDQRPMRTLTLQHGQIVPLPVPDADLRLPIRALAGCADRLLYAVRTCPVTPSAPMTGIPTCTPRCGADP